MKIIVTISLVIAILIIAIVSFMAYARYFTKVTVSEREVGGYVIAGLDYTGKYSNVGASMMKADSIIRSLGVNCTKGFGIYYDNPNTTATDSCRSYVGNIIENPDSLIIEKLKSNGLRVDSIEKKKSAVVEFLTPNKFSYFVGPMKAYPALNKYVEKNGLKTTLSCEIYDMSTNITLYTFQIE